MENLNEILGKLDRKNFSVGVLLLKRPILLKSYSRISTSSFYNSTFFEVGLFYKPISEMVNNTIKKKNE